MAAFALVVWADRRFRLGHGRVLALYVMTYTVGRVWIEGLRIDDVQLSDVLGLRFNEWTSIVLFLLAGAYFVWAGRKHPGREESVYVAAGARGRATAEDPVCGLTIAVCTCSTRQPVIEFPLARANAVPCRSPTTSRSDRPVLDGCGERDDDGRTPRWTPSHRLQPSHFGTTCGPPGTGLYDPRHEHDACGVAFVATLTGVASHDIVAKALTALRNLDHRGAAGAETNSGDGAGILMQVPDAFLRDVVDFDLPRAGQLRRRHRVPARRRRARSPRPGAGSRRSPTEEGLDRPRLARGPDRPRHRSARPRRA